MRTLPAGAYTITTQTRTLDVAGTIQIDEYGYWVQHDNAVILHVAHGSLLSIEPATPDVTPTAQTARDKLHAKAGR